MYEELRAELDQQHKDIFTIIDRISVLIENRIEDASLVKYLDLLLNITARHYKFEEELMSQFKPSLAEEHIEQHRKTLLCIHNLRNKIQAEIVEHNLLYSEALKDWKQHIDKFDTELIATLNEAVLQSNQEEPPDAR